MRGEGGEGGEGGVGGMSAGDEGRIESDVIKGVA
jgi:hypothetical protein